MTDAIERHYATDNIAERVLSAVRATLPEGVPLTADDLAPVDHFHGRGVVATKEMAAALAPKAGECILDIGSGIGGPARWIASHYQCHVTGVDLTKAFCEAAIALNAATGLEDRVTIVHGSALSLPIADASFDRAYSQNVVMNIADKMTFYREARRVLKPGGILVLSNIAQGPGGDVIYPTPWATSAATSFLSTPETTRQEIEATGLRIRSFRDMSADVLPGMRALRQKIVTEGMPRLSAHVFMGDRMQTFQLNSFRNAEEGRVLSIEVVAERPLQ